MYQPHGSWYRIAHCKWAIFTEIHKFRWYSNIKRAVPFYEQDVQCKSRWTYVTWSRGMSRMLRMLFLRYWQKNSVQIPLFHIVFRVVKSFITLLTRYPIAMRFASKWSIFRYWECERNWHFQQATHFHWSCHIWAWQKKSNIWEGRTKVLKWYHEMFKPSL